MEEGLDRGSVPATASTATLAGNERPDNLICPFLGVARDPQSRFPHPSPGHVCHAGRPAAIAADYQVEYCLGGAYERCVRFERVVGQTADGRPLSTAGERSWVATVAMTVLTLVLLAAVVALVVARSPLPTKQPGAVASGTPRPTDGITIPPPTTPAPTAPPAATASPATLPTSRPARSPSPEPSPTAITFHVVQPGESLSTIADLYGLPWPLIAQANDIDDPDEILAGQRLTIPPLPQPGTDDLVHEVQRGETILDIALAYGVSPEDLADANGLANWNRIYVGQRLIIPGGSGAESPLETP